MRLKLLPLILLAFAVFAASQNDTVVSIEQFEEYADGGNSTNTTTTASSTENSTAPSTENSTAPSTESSTAQSSTTEVPESWDEYPVQVPGEKGKPPCIFSKMNITLKVAYQTTNNTNVTGTVVVPEKLKVSGSCNDTVSSMILSWNEKALYIRSFRNVYADEESKITFNFKKDNSSISVNEINVNIFLDKTHFPDAKETRLEKTIGNLTLFATPPNGSKYVCNIATDVSTEDESVLLSIKDVNLIAFNDDENLSQKSEENCQVIELTESANVGAIVGGVIAAVVVVGIIGLVIWRRRKNSYGHSEVP